jgi:NAD(P)-dependent dehydrogenase (short-subunit alcohol dehydrogenase family)
MAELFILTGASRGLGLAMAEQLLAPEVRLLTLARQPGTELAARAQAAGCALTQLACDLAEPVVAATQLEAWLAQQDGGSFVRATLINNAGAIGVVGPIEQDDAGQVARLMRVNLEAPMLLARAFLAATAAWPGTRRVLNVSSGAGRRAIAGWSVYCAAKAGLDHFTRVLAADEALKPRGARVCSLAPGVIDTGMQAQLRAADGAGFPDQSLFHELKRSGQLASPADAAARVLAFLARPDFGTEPVADVRS